MPEPIRVAQVGPDSAGKGGMAAVMRDILASPLAERYEMQAIVTWRGFRPLERAWVFLTGLASLARWCAGRGRRIVHIHGAARGSLYRKSLCVFLARLLRRPVLLQIHAGPGDIEEFAARLGAGRVRLFGLALGAATRVLAVSAASARAMERGFGAAGIAVIPNAAPAVAAEALGEDLGELDPGVLFLGGFQNPVKGGDLLVETLTALAGELPGTEFALAGPGEPPAALAALERGHDNVSWIGWLDEAAKREALLRQPIFVLPSLSEGLPVALLEAMAWGRAIVATRIGGVPDVVEDGAEALIVPAGDPAALATALRRLAGDPELRRRLGAAARRRALALNEDEVYGRLSALYEELAR
jgi:glycosyltransferase involved in cell wall biosynthesis